MKSIIEEGSSIFKAIEKGWTQAGKPTDFSVKIYEEPVTNFFGFTTKPAKIAIFFEDKAPARHAQQSSRRQGQASQHAQQPAREQGHRENDRRPHQKQPREQRPQQHGTQQRTLPAAPQQERNQERTERTREPRILWNDAMIQAAQEWVNSLLSTMNKNTKYTVEVKNYYLKFTFASNILENNDKDRQLFRNSAYLVMQSLRHKFKKSLRGYKVIMSGPTHS